MPFEKVVQMYFQVSKSSFGIIEIQIKVEFRIIVAPDTIDIETRLIDTKLLLYIE